MPKMQEHFLTAMDGGNAENAGCNFRPARHLLGYLAIVPEAADIAEMQEHFPASHGGPDAEKQNAIFGRRAT